MNNELANVTFQDMLTQAETLRASGFLPKSISTPQQAVAIMTMGKELGIGMWAAFNGINVIQGKPTISPQLMLALINRSGQLDDMRVEGNNEVCAVTMARRGRTPHTETFSMADAGAMSLAGKDNWRKQPAIMLKWRAVAACARVVFSDIVMGFYSPEEINPDAVIDYDTGELVQEHPALEDEVAQDTRETQQDAISGAHTPTGTPEAVAGLKRPYGANELRDSIQQSIVRRNEKSDIDVSPVTDDQARKLAIQWRNVMAGTDAAPDKARYIIIEYMLGFMPLGADGMPSFKGLNAVERTVLEVWLSDVKAARAEADNVWQELAALAEAAEVEPLSR